MAIQTNAFPTYTAKGNREDLTNMIYNIDPFETPALNAIERTTASAVGHEWQTDNFVAGSSSNAQLEGAVIGNTATLATSRPINTCQILSKDVTVTGTQEKVKKAGRTSEMAYQMYKRGKEIKRDLSLTVFGNVARVAGTTAVARKMRSWESWMTSNVNRETTATSGGTKGKSATSATGIATDATGLRTFTQAMVDKVMEAAFANGANGVKYMAMSPHSKTVFSRFAGRTGSQVPVKLDRIQGNATLFASNFGDLLALPDNFVRSRTVFGIDPTMAAVAFLRPMFMKDIPATGDYIQKAIWLEATLEMRNQAAHFVISDVKTSS